MVYALHLAALLKKEELTKGAYEAEDEEVKKIIQSEAMKSAKEVYLICLFILMANDKQYGGVKTALGDNYLLGKQEYPQYQLAAKRLLAYFKGGAGQDEEGGGNGGRARIGVRGRGEGDEVYPHLPRLRQKVQGRVVARVPAHH